MKRAIFLAFLLMLALLVVPIGNQAIAKDNLKKEELLALIVQLEQRVDALEAASATQAALNQEIADRVAADDAETAARIAADAALQASLNAETATRVSNDDALKGMIDGLEADLTNETLARESADDTLQTQIDTIDATALEARILDLENNSVIALDGMLALDSSSGVETALFEGVRVQVINGSGGGIIEATADGLTITSDGDLTLDAGDELNSIAENTNIESIVKTTMDSFQAEIKTSGEMTLKGSKIHLN
jgi:hypothetical protein